MSALDMLLKVSFSSDLSWLWQVLLYYIEFNILNGNTVNDFMISFIDFIREGCIQIWVWYLKIRISK